MTETETKLIEVLTRGLKLQRAAPITTATAIFGKPNAPSSDGSAAVDGLGLDSVDVLEIAVLLDKHFGVMLEEQNDEVHAALANIGALALYIDRHKP